MTKAISKVKLTSEKGLLLVAGLGVAVNVILTLFIIFGLKPSSETATLVAAFSVVAMTIGLITVVLSIIAVIKVRLSLKVVPVLYIILTAGLVLLAYFNIWWLGY